MLRMKKSRWLVLTVTLVLVLSIGVGIALSYIITGTSPLENIFDPVRASCEVVSANGQSAVKNTGNTPIYVRCTTVINWHSNDGEIYAKSPVEGTDYTITLSSDPLWIRGADGYWYYCQPLEPDAETVALIEQVALIGEAPDGYSLSAHLLTSAVQAIPTDAVEQAWGVTVAGNTIIP